MRSAVIIRVLGSAPTAAGRAMRSLAALALPTVALSVLSAASSRVEAQQRIVGRPAQLQPPVTVVRAADAREWESIASAEDARAATSGQLATLLAGTRSASADMRRISIRALGRLQRAELADSIAPFLADRDPALRTEAARALALASVADRTPDAVRARIRTALATETHPGPIAALAETLGRLRNANADSARIVAAQLARYVDRDPTIRLGAVRGLHFIARQGAAVRVGVDTARSALIRVATARFADTTEAGRHARRLATETLAITGLGTEEIAMHVLRDIDAVTRREAVLIAGPQMRDTAAAYRIVSAALKDRVWLVRFEAMRQLGPRLAGGRPCSIIRPYIKDPVMHVRLEAIDALGTRCTIDAATTRTLDSIARTLPDMDGREWRPAAHALTALATRDAARASALLPRFATHQNLFVRMYADSAATALRDTGVLQRLARDPVPNVRAAAVRGLRRIMRHDADAIYLEQLSSDDSQLLMETAAALDSTKTPDVASRMLDALDRVSAQKRENSRDGRVALLNTIARVGDASLAPRLTPYLRDFDPAVAVRASAALRSWGAPADTAPQRMPAESVPGFVEAIQLVNARLRVEMENGSVFDVQLLPFDAPTNAARFARLARAGYFNGLTLHRVEPNFVVQGGSPNANEYAGAPRFSRDEVGYPNNRGTIGLSTRGHDTGDAQIFINIIDNTQLDQQYTVFAVVTSGMTAVEGILEGASIRRITFR